MENYDISFKIRAVLPSQSHENYEIKIDILSLFSPMMGGGPT